MAMKIGQRDSGVESILIVSHSHTPRQPAIAHARQMTVIHLVGWNGLPLSWSTDDGGRRLPLVTSLIALIERVDD